jgi:F5/8 type C domain-containing protein
VTPTSTPTLPTPGQNLALGHPATASTTWSASYAPAAAFDGSDTTRWAASAGSTVNQWIAVDLGALSTYDRVVLKEISFARVSSFKIQSSNDGTTYVDISGASGTTIGAAKTVTFAAVASRHVRVFIVGATQEPTLNDIQVLSASGPPAPTPTPTPTAPPSGINLALNRPATSSTSWSASYDAAKAVDGSDGTRWSASSGSSANQWLAVDLGAAPAYDRVVLEEISFARVTAFKLQSSNDGVTYADIPGTAGTTIGASKAVTFTARTARYVRLLITAATAEPTINELQVLSAGS